MTLRSRARNGSFLTGRALSRLFPSQLRPANGTAMPQAIVDPDELRHFARSLKKFTSELRERSNALGNHLNTLGTTWRDQEQRKFTEDFEQHLQAIHRFAEASEQYIPYLLRKAEHIEDYLQS